MHTSHNHQLLANQEKEEDHEDDEDAVAESFEEDNGDNSAEVTALEVEITDDFNDLSGEYSDNENTEEELQALVTSSSLSAVANESSIQKSSTYQQRGKSQT